MARSSRISAEVPAEAGSATRMAKATIAPPPSNAGMVGRPASAPLPPVRRVASRSASGIATALAASAMAAEA